MTEPNSPRTGTASDLNNDPSPNVVVVGPDGLPVGNARLESAIENAEAEQNDSVGDLVEEPAKVMRIGTMIKQLLEEVRVAPLDDASRNRVREIHQTSIRELEKALAPELQDELERLVRPFTEDSTPSDAELRIAQAQLVEMGCGVLDVGEIRTGGAASPADQRHRRGQRQLARELTMPAVGEIDQRRHRAAIIEMDRPNGFPVDAVIVDLAVDQITPHRVILLGRQSMGEAAARAARQQAEDEARLLRRAAIVLRIDAEGPMPTVQARGSRLRRSEARIPHQRAVAEDPAWPGAVRKQTPHPEEHAAGVRLEGWDRAPRLFPPFETRPCGPLLRARWWWW